MQHTTPPTAPQEAFFATFLPQPDSTVTTQLVAALDYGRLNELFASFLQLLGIPVALLSLDGKLLASSGMLPAPSSSQHQSGVDTADIQDTAQHQAQQQKPAHNLSITRSSNGLTTCSTPILLNGEHIANLQLGQFLLQQPGLDVSAELAKTLSGAQAIGQAEISDIPVVDQSKLPVIMTLLCALARQITELSLLSLRFQQSLQHTEQQVALRTQELLLQNQILSQISEGSELASILHNLVAQVELLHPDMLCSILLLDDDGKTLRHGAAPSLPDEYNKALDGVTIGIGVGSCGTAAFTGDTVIVADITSHPYWQPYLALAQLAGVKACWSQPIKNAKDKVLGTFAIYHRQPTEPSAELLQKIKTYGNLAELAISRSLSALQIRKLAFYDSLTGLANRRLLEEHILQAMASSERSQHYCGLMFIDLDNFKPVNDGFGHKTGDTLLIEVARRLQASVRSADTVARFGGDEFIVLLRDIDSDLNRCQQHMQHIASKICHELAQPYQLSGQLLHRSSCSIGMVLFQADSSCDELLRRADMAMYQAKREGQHRACWYNAEAS